MSEMHTTLESAAAPMPELFSESAVDAPLDDLLGDQFVGWTGAYKRVFDMVGAGAALLFFALPMLAIAIAIKREDGGPVFYRQQRLTRGRRRFTMLKFRTMVVDAEREGPVFAQQHDPRCTRIGRRLRDYCLDELPQLFNVLTGEMSLIGPRPERPEMLEQIRREIPEFPLRLTVRAGLTGWAQIHGLRGRTCFRTRLAYDLHYVRHWSPLLDVRILLATPRRILPDSKAK